MPGKRDCDDFCKRKERKCHVPWLKETELTKSKDNYEVVLQKDRSERLGGPVFSPWRVDFKELREVRTEEHRAI